MSSMMDNNNNNNDDNDLACDLCTCVAYNLMAICDHCLLRLLTMRSRFKTSGVLNSGTTAADECSCGHRVHDGRPDKRPPVDQSGDDIDRKDTKLRRGIRSDDMLDTLIGDEITSRALFGTFVAQCLAIELRRKWLRLLYVTPNITGIQFAYNITIPFIDMNRLIICIDNICPLVFIETTPEANSKIQLAMGLTGDTADGYRLDVTSGDPIERYIVVELNHSLDTWFPLTMTMMAKEANPLADVHQISQLAARRYLRQYGAKISALNYRQQLHCL